MTFEYGKHVSSRAEIVVGMAADALRCWRDRREFARFVHDNPAEADRLARDLNIGTASLMKIAGQGPPVLLYRRLRALGIEPERLRRSEPRVVQDLARCCALCSCKVRCTRDLDRRPGDAIWRTYCLNKSTIEALQPLPA